MKANIYSRCLFWVCLPCLGFGSFQSTNRPRNFVYFCFHSHQIYPPSLRLKEGKGLFPSVSSNQTKRNETSCSCSSTLVWKGVRGHCTWSAVMVSWNPVHVFMGIRIGTLFPVGLSFIQGRYRHLSNVCVFVLISVTRIYECQRIFKETPKRMLWLCTSWKEILFVLMPGNNNSNIDSLSLI